MARKAKQVGQRKSKVIRSSKIIKCAGKRSVDYSLQVSSGASILEGKIDANLGVPKPGFVHDNLESMTERFPTSAYPGRIPVLGVNQ